MKSHFCPKELTVLSYENECNWCEEKEMTQDEIIRMAREAGFHIENWSFGERVSVYESGKTIDITNELKDFAALVAAHEREKQSGLVEIIENLWNIIDDIDTYGDMAKADNKLYRSLVERRQKDRWKTGITTDGYTLTIPDVAVSIEAAVLAEREACAKVCDVLRERNFWGAEDCAAAIRARGEK